MFTVEKDVILLKYTDLHTHTIFSDGAYTVEELVKLAAKEGLAAVGISDHSFTEFDQRYCMKANRLDEYIKEIRRVQELYKDRIEVYAGLEYDGYSELDGSVRFDYLIGSCHYIKAPDGSYHSVDHALSEHWHAINEYFNCDPIAYARTYFETYEARTRAHRPDILGHYDLVSKFNVVGPDNPEYRKMSVEALESCLKITPVIELNTKPLVKGWKDETFPGTFLLKEIFRLNGKIILSSDFHGAEKLGGWFVEGTELLKSIGFKSMIVIRKGKLEEAGI